MQITHNLYLETVHLYLRTAVVIMITVLCHHRMLSLYTAHTEHLSNTDSTADRYSPKTVYYNDL